MIFLNFFRDIEIETLKRYGELFKLITLLKLKFQFVSVHSLSERIRKMKNVTTQQK